MKRSRFASDARRHTPTPWVPADASSRIGALSPPNVAVRRDTSSLAFGAWRLASAKRGFTLVELLVVIAILSLLAGILFPVLAQTRAKAREAACMSNLRQIGLGLRMYRDDFDELPPHLSRLFPAYVNDPRLFVCPGDPQKGHRNGNNFLEADLYLKSGVSYDYLTNWSEAIKLGWWHHGPQYGPGKWDAMTPISQCAWHWATQFYKKQTGGNLPGSKGWMFVLTAGGSVRRFRVETPLAQLTPEMLR
jgi:prepilin-type N-terminal cleavage/methylation domain-containing protein